MKVLLLFILLNFSVLGQHNGFFGKTNYIEINSLNYIPLINNIFNGDLDYTSYKKKGSKLVEQKDWFETGIRLAVGHSIKDNLGLGIEFGIDFQNIPAPLADELIAYKYEKLSFGTITILPKIELTNSSGLLPMGLSHQLGIGYTISKAISKEYRIKPGNDIHEVTTITFNDKFSGLTVLYALNMRTPLSKSLMLNYGFRYTYNRVFERFDTLENPLLLSGNAIMTLIQRRRVQNIITFNLGLTLVF